MTNYPADVIEAARSAYQRELGLQPSKTAGRRAWCAALAVADQARVTAADARYQQPPEGPDRVALAASIAMEDYYRSGGEYHLVAMQVALAAADKARWRSIETAPLDGTWVLVATPLALPITLGTYDSRTGAGRVPRGWVVLQSDGALWPWVPARWQPLPPPPDDA